MGLFVVATRFKARKITPEDDVTQGHCRSPNESGFEEPSGKSAMKLQCPTLKLDLTPR